MSVIIYRYPHISGKMSVTEHNPTPTRATTGTYNIMSIIK